MKVSIERLCHGDEEAVRSLLVAAELPVEDLDDAKLRSFLVAREDEERVVGAVGLEAFGKDGLLRSLVVDDSQRGRGLGIALTEALEDFAASRGVRTLYLLTTTAADFFPKLDYEPALRAAVPEAIAATEEFASVCPASAACLAKRLAPSAALRAMRRREKEMTSRAEIDELLHDAETLRLGLAVDDEPYVVPVSFGYDGRCLYFHTAREGRKLEFLAANPRVCFEAERGVRLVTDPEQACRFTFDYECVIGYGEVRELTERDEKAAGLDRVMEHYAEGDWSYPEKVLSNTRVFAIEIESVSGKRSGGKPGM